MRNTPSSFFHSLILTPTENPSLKPSAASNKESSPAIVAATLKVASMPVSSAVMSIKRPIGRVRSCSSNNLTGFEKSIESFSNIVAPALVMPFSSQDTILPEIVRFLLSAAVRVIGKLIFIGLSPPPLVFVRYSSHRYDLGFHKLVHALTRIHVRNHQDQNVFRFR